MKIKYTGSHKKFVMFHGYTGELVPDQVVDVEELSYKELIVRDDFKEVVEKEEAALEEKKQVKKGQK